MRLKDDRNWFLVLLLTIITFGIYMLYLIHVMAKDTNEACKEDGNNTWGLGLYLLLSIFTFGIGPIIWQCMIISRWENYAGKNGEIPKCTIISYLLWYILGSFIIIGPIIAFVKFIKGFNQTCKIYNSKIV